MPNWGPLKNALAIMEILNKDVSISPIQQAAERKEQKPDMVSVSNESKDPESNVLSIYSRASIRGMVFALWLLSVGFIVYLIAMLITRDNAIAIVASVGAVLVGFWKTGDLFFPTQDYR
jgi:ribosomal protein S12 methylthiotransferase accessory factor YcaO